MKTRNKDLESTVKDYVLGRLSETEAEEFETYFLARPEIIALVEEVQSEHIGSAESHPSKVDAGNASSTVWNSIRSWLTVPASAVAAIALALVAVPLAINFQAGSNNLDNVYVAAFSTATTRGFNQNEPASSRKIDLSNEQGITGLFIKVKPDVRERYQLNVFAEGVESPVWISEPFQVSSGLRDYFVILPKEAALADARVQLVAVDRNQQTTPVEFCHYSEVCN